MVTVQHILTHHNPGFGLLLIILSMMSATSANSDAISEKQIDAMEMQTQSIKNEAIELSSKLLQLEEKLLFPAHTQVTVFLSIAKSNSATPQAISLKIDNKNITHHIYTQDEVLALHEGGVQRLYTGNTKMGKHKLSIALNEILPDKELRKSEIVYSFNKTENVKYIEFIVDRNQAKDKQLSFRNWN